MCGDPQVLSKWKENAATIGRTKYNWSHAESTLLTAYKSLLNPAAVSSTKIRQET
jgi:hypothetical protein